LEGWIASGEAFGHSGPGDVMIVPGAKEPVQPVLSGLAHSGLVSLKLYGALRSPTFVIKHKKIHYRVAGKQAKVNLILNGLQLIRSPIYGDLTFAVNNESLHWRTQDVSMWIGQRAYIEILDEGPGYAAIEQVVFSDDAQPPKIASVAPEPLRLEADRLAALQPLLEAYRKADADLP